ncbi:MAG: hypothetical protein FWF94_07240 [Oscillospiraceae bacterium]|nr:hypothetical protein [Oscillospiraceae bacterium]
MIRRKYSFVQFLLELFSLFQLFLTAVCIIDVFIKAAQANSAFVKAAEGEMLKARFEPVIIWGVLSLIVFVSAIVLPFIFAKKTMMNQRQYNYWVYCVYLIRVLVLLMIFYILEMHVNFLIRTPQSLFNFGIITTAVLTVIIVKFTQIRIKAAQTKEIKEEREITEG